MEINNNKNKTSSGDVIGSVDFFAQDGDRRVLAGQIQVVATAMADAGKAPVRYDFYAHNTAGSLTKIMSVDQNGFGYAAGVGGTVTQTSSKAVAVSLNALTGQITLNNSTLNSATTTSFTLTNTLIAATDLLVLNHVSGGTVGAYTLNAACAAGSASISIRNVTANNLSEAPVIAFAVVKGATT